MIDKVFYTIKKFELIEKGEKLIAGVSGGPDSVCLLHVLNSLSEKLNITIYTVHINHMLRGNESDDDEQYVRQLCASLGIPLYVVRCDIIGISAEQGISVEEAGREERYRQFEMFAKQLGASKIAVAHNRNDQAETVIMNIIRGSGLDGLTGMDYKKGKIIRPLLDIGRQEIDNYCSEYSLNPRTDSSNLKSIYTRNRIRLELIPFINDIFNTSITDSIVKMSGLLKSDLDFIEACSGDAYRKCRLPGEMEAVLLDLRKTGMYHTAVVKRMIRSAIREVKGDLKGIESVHIDAAEALLMNGRTGSVIHLPDNVRVLKSYDTVRFFIERKINGTGKLDIEIPVPGITVISKAGITVEASLEKKSESIEMYDNIRYNALEQFFDYEKFKMGINIRNRKDGDIFKPFKSNGTKKLKEYFIDNKIPREQRDKILLAAIDNEIAWIIGYKISDKFKVTENTKIVLRLKIIDRKRSNGGL